MNISTDDVMVFTDPSSESYYEDNIWKGFALVATYIENEISMKIHREMISIAISYVCF